ncbi:putative prefoldin subunit 4 [Paratrimastix pyriformis]|uniref:Prefoldin subunit 4 n=1 Tax=Paratrimastix pyriformis TaxID=342808 RepID=A0ABQ8UJ83_9EUKA|nr:putative prefoldin subunit 4 [Paratrimastix pyriformis]
MQAREDENDVQVTWEDQKMICTFSQKNARAHELSAEIESLEAKSKNWQDAVDEFMMPEQDEQTHFRVLYAETFLHLPKDNAERLIEAKKAAIDEDVERLKGERSALQRELAVLKATLYGKFKSSINLEEDK